MTTVKLSKDMKKIAMIIIHKKHITALRNFFRHILLLLILLSLPVYSGIEVDSLEHSDDIDSIEFTEVIEDVYVDKSEHSLIIESVGFKSIAYTDTSAVLQLIEVTKDFRWAILISMPAEVDRRAETSYLLIDIKNRENMNSFLETETYRYLDGNYMEFKTSFDGKAILNCEGYDGENYEIKLK